MLSFKTLNIIWKEQLVFQSSLKGFLSNKASTSFVPSYRVSWWHLYVAFTLKIFPCASFFLYFSLIVSLFFFRIKIDKTIYFFLFADTTVKVDIKRTCITFNERQQFKVPFKILFQKISTSLHTCFSDKFKIHNTHQREINIYYWKQTINKIVSKVFISNVHRSARVTQDETVRVAQSAIIYVTLSITLLLLCVYTIVIYVYYS